MRRLVNSFLSGEISKMIAGRLDSDVYSAGCSRLENMYVHRQGGISRRPPLKKVGSTVFSSTNVRISREIPFTISASESYKLLLGERTNEDPATPDNSIYLYDGTSYRNLIDSQSSQTELIARFHNTWGRLNEAELRKVRFANYYNDLYLVHESCPLLRLRRISSLQSVLEFPEVRVNQDVRPYNISLNDISLSTGVGGSDYHIYVGGVSYGFTKGQNDTVDQFCTMLCNKEYDGWKAVRTTTGIDFVPMNKADAYSEYKCWSNPAPSGVDYTIDDCDFKITRDSTTIGINYKFERTITDGQTGLVAGEDDFYDMKLNVENNYASKIAVISERLWLCVNGDPCRTYVSRPYGTSQIIAPKSSNDTILDFIQFELLASTTDVLKSESDLDVEVATDTNGYTIYKGTSYAQEIWEYSSDEINTKSDYDNAYDVRKCIIQYGDHPDREGGNSYRRVDSIKNQADTWEIIWNIFFHITSDDGKAIAGTTYYECDYSKLSKDASGDYYSSVYKWYNSSSSAQTEDEKYENITVDNNGTHGLIYNYIRTQDVYKDVTKKYYEWNSSTSTYDFVSNPSGNPMSSGYYERQVCFTSDYKTKVYEKYGEYVYANAQTTPLNTIYDEYSGRILSISSGGNIVCEAIPYYQYKMSTDSDIYTTQTTLDKTATRSTGMEMQLASGRNDRISWIALGTDIMIGTESSEWRMDTAINALDGKASKYSAFGSTNGLVTYVGTDLIFLQKGNKLRLLYKDYYGLQNIELTITNPEIMDGEIINMCGFMDPEPAIAILKSNTVGTTETRSIVFLSVDRTNGVQAFARWTTELYIHDICITEDSGNQILTALCEDDGKRFLAEFDFGSTVYSDCGYDEALKDDVHPYDSLMTAMPFDTLLQDGSVTLGEAKNVSKIIFRCLDTGHVTTWYSEKDRTTTRSPVCCDRQGNYIGGLADMAVNVNGGTTRDLMISVGSVGKEPMTLLAMAYDLRINKNGV